MTPSPTSASAAIAASHRNRPRAMPTPLLADLSFATSVANHFATSVSSTLIASSSPSQATTPFPLPSRPRALQPRDGPHVPIAIRQVHYVEHEQPPAVARDHRFARLNHRHHELHRAEGRAHRRDEREAEAAHSPRDVSVLSETPTCELAPLQARSRSSANRAVARFFVFTHCR